jgi:thiamine biosynthesis lipoprotein
MPLGYRPDHIPCWASPSSGSVLGIFEAVRVAGGLALMLLASGCGASDSAHELRLEGEALGTSWSVEMVTRHAVDASGSAALKGRVVATLERVDRGMSTWRDDAEIARFNRARGLEPFAFSPETRRVVRAALELARETGGAFDPTVAPLVALWGFGAEAATGEPGAAELARARQRVGWSHLAWNANGALVRRVPGVQLDLSAIAKGYAVDAIAAELAREGPLGLLVEVGGEVRTIGAKAGGQRWRVGVDHPDAPGARLEAVVALAGAALATSGDYRQVRVVEGRRRSHLVDPRTGTPVDNGVASASVIAPTSMEADAVATALMVLGPDEGLAWVEDRPWLEALLLIRSGGRVSSRRASSGWSNWLVDPGR